MRLIIPTFCGLLVCTGQAGSDSKDDKCATHLFSKQISKYEIRAQYDDCDPEYKSRLKILLGSVTLYSADTLKEFEFGDHSWPNYLKVADNKDQVLLEVNDRPLKNYILCLTFTNDRLTKVDEFHSFENDPKDFDNDGLLEYAGFRDWIEPFSSDSTYFHPIQYVERGKDGFKVDSILNRLVNIKLYGEIPQSPTIHNVYKNVPDDSLKKYLNSVDN